MVVEQGYFNLRILQGNDDHPSHDVSVGQWFVEEAYEALRASPQWNEILSIVTYVEHGGFYDHVTTPGKGAPSPDGIVGLAPYYFKFDHLRVRVPTFLISPWIEPGTATVKNIFKLKEFLTKRDAWSGAFESLLTRRPPRILSRLTGHGRLHASGCLNGGHKKDTYPNNLAEDLTVADAVKYNKQAFQKFINKSNRAKKNGAHEDTIVTFRR
ncbi:hypothetical protein Nepgr_000351 [Nepenthes gracilis]|uniref:Phospholipase C n=1 Tax=Nepenthes gracilis TaxID=150966 RepID=A0AAD3P3Q0_NEPGR|nr:hypothetical protein Nepgr_000351 [Nepenthes gracilis]